MFFFKEKIDMDTQLINEAIEKQPVQMTLYKCHFEKYVGIESAIHEYMW